MQKTLSNKIVSIAVACFAAIGIFAILFVFASISAFSNDLSDAYITKDGQGISALLLEEHEKVAVEVFAGNKAKGYCWQILDDEDENRWIDIAETNSPELSVTYALVASMLRLDGTTAIRCELTAKNDELFHTKPVDIKISYHVNADSSQPYDASQNMAVRPMMFATKRAVEHTTCSIVINYLFDNNALAFEPYGASVATGSDFEASITSPTVMGYAPYRRVGENYVEASVVELNIKNIQENVTINVIYEPTLVDFKIHHHLQNLENDEYSLHADFITTSQAITGSVVGEGLAYSAEQLPGFKALDYEKLTVAADGSTVIEIRYDRNYYLVDFDMNGGYGTEPVYTRYGATVGANTPVRHGYIFDGWELVSYGGHHPTAEQESKYELLEGKTIILPDANLRYRARWITQNTNYTMVFWKENANDNDYSYWGYLSGLTALSGSHVNGQDLISEVDGINDEQYFTFNSEKTDKNILVEGDGSTVVNVYYTRNYYRLNFVATGECSIEPNHTHDDACYEKVCGLGHTHTEECLPTLVCDTTEHIAHTEECLKQQHGEHIHGSADCACNLAEHTHIKSCWANVGNAQSSVNGNPPRDPEDGEVYRYRSFFGSSTYYIYIKGTWYRYNSQGAVNGAIVDPTCGYTEHMHGTNCACDIEAHKHTAECYRDILHTHVETCYNYSCGEIDHTHTDGCNRLICGIIENHTHTSNCTKSNQKNTVKTVYRKYEESLDDIWPITDDNGITYDGGERWKPSNSSYFSQVMVYAATMNPENFTLTLDEASYTPYTMNYWLQVLPGEAYTTSYNGRNYVLAHTIKASYNYVTKAEDFFDIAGFDQAESDPTFSNNQISISGNDKTVDFYYARKTDHYLRFNNNGTVLDDKSVYGIMYGAPLAQYNFTPDYPGNLEPNAYSFVGWYTSPGCFAGTEVNWESITMTEGDLLLYAKWAPITHTVKVFKDFSLSEQIGDTQTVEHKAFAVAPTDSITNGNYVFQGWFYLDDSGNEKAFVFTGIPIVDDMNIYAKWSSHVSVNYTIQYKLWNTDISIADPTTGSAIAGNNKTFEAKAGEQLYANYQTGYYPLTNSHTITMGVDTVHEFTFYYVFVESMPYIVEYIDVNTGDKLFPDKKVEDNALSVVTETFIKYEGKMPDAYQKRLILSASGNDSDKDGILDENRITFYYSSDAEHAYYRVVHYIRNISGDAYREYRSEEVVGVIGTRYTVEAIALTGFEFMKDKTVVNGIVTPVNENSVSAVLGADGMLIELYYDRIMVEYKVQYLDATTGDSIIPDKSAKGVFGEQVAEYARDLSSFGYNLTSDNLKLLVLSTTEELNVLTFLYQEKTVSIKYEIVGPSGCGSLSQYSENVGAITGSPNGSQPIVAKGFAFVGWFKDADCLIPVADDAINPNTHKLTPRKAENSIWEDNTFYYAQYIALTTDMTIQVSSAKESDNQTFLFQIKGIPNTLTEDFELTVSVTGNSSVTIKQVPIGSYTIMELTGWSWRYDSMTHTQNITLKQDKIENIFIFNHNRTNGKWLDGNAKKINVFTKE